MAQPETAAGGEDLIVHVEPTVEDRLSAALNEAPEEQQDEEEAPPEAEETEAPEAEEESPEDEPEIEIEAEDLPPIEAPISWNAEDKAKFAELPRHLQETVGKREAEREKFVQTKAQEAAQAREAAQSEALRYTAQLKAETVEHLQHYAKQFEIAPPDARLFAENPAAYAQQLETYQYAQAQRQQAQQEAEQARVEAEKYQTALQQHEAQAFRQRLEAELPEAFKEDGQTNKEFIDSLAATAEALGYDDNAIQNASVEELKALKSVGEWKAKAAKYDKAMAKQMERVREGKKLPPVSKPGAAKAPGSGQASRYQADREAMKRGDKDAELRVLRAHLNT